MNERYITYVMLNSLLALNKHLKVFPTLYVQGHMEKTPNHHKVTTGKASGVVQYL
jgi:hypothetical protein